MGVILIAAVALGICFLLDKGFQKVFRSKQEHKFGKSLRQSKRYGSVGLILAVFGLAGLISGYVDQPLVLWGGILILLVGAGLIAYYLGTGIYYDSDTFLVESIGKKSRTYRYADIQYQQLYVLQGGSLIVELYMVDEKTVQLLSTMAGYDDFLEHAFRKWCQQRGIVPDSCSFYDPENSLWFPKKEDIECTSQV